MRGLFRRKPVTGKHALGAAVTAIPSAPLRAPVPGPTPVRTWEDWQYVASSPPAAAATAATAATAPEPDATDRVVALPSSSAVPVSAVPVSAMPDWVAPSADGQDLSAQEVADLLAIAPLVAPDLLTEIAALLATGEAWATTEPRPAALPPGVSAAVPSLGQPAGSLAGADLPAVPGLPTAPTSVLPTTLVPVPPTVPVRSLPTAPAPALPTAPAPVLLPASEPGRVSADALSVPVLLSAPPLEAGVPLSDAEVPAPWTYAVLGVAPSPAEPEPAAASGAPTRPTAPVPTPAPAPVASTCAAASAPGAPHLDSPVVVVAPAVTAPRPAAAAVVPAVLATAAPLPPSAVGPSAVPAAPAVGPPAVVAAAPPPVQAAPAVPAGVPSASDVPVIVTGRVLPQPLGSAPSSRSALEAALAELLPEPAGGEAYAQPPAQPSAQPPAPLRVQLGFRDGTSTALDPASDQSRALQDLARSLTRRD